MMRLSREEKDLDEAIMIHLDEETSEINQKGQNSVP